MDVHCTPSFDVYRPLGSYVGDASLPRYCLLLKIESVMTVISKTYSSSSMTRQR